MLKYGKGVAREERKLKAEWGATEAGRKGGPPALQECVFRRKAPPPQAFHLRLARGDSVLSGQTGNVDCSEQGADSTST